MKILLPEGEPWLKSGDTLVCFGDSLTAGEDSYTTTLQKRLGEKGINVINSGLGGDKTPHALTRVFKDVIDHKPTAVSIFLGTNDMAIGRGVWSDEPMVQPGTFKDNLMWIIHICRLYGKIEKFSIATPMMKLEGAAFNSYGFIGMEYGKAAREAADASNALCVPLDTEFFEAWLSKRAEAENGLLFTKDGTHMKPDGYVKIAEIMMKYWNLL